MIYLDQDIIEEHKDQTIDAELRKKINSLSLATHKGEIKVGGSISYVQQIPWIQNKTIRENILFGYPLDVERYNRTIEICQLVSDLELLPGGDLTEIGEKGINLSGGQKARISLARAVYANRDIVLMDDPISALDSNVKKKVFEQVFMGEMRGKTRILVTHAVDFIDRVDRIIIMENSKIKYMGTYEELQHSDEIKHIVETLASHQIHNDDEEDAENKLEEVKKIEDIMQDMPAKNYLSQEGMKITVNENDESIDVGWDIYAAFFLRDYTWIIYILIIPLFVAYSYLIVYNTLNIGKFVENSENKHLFWQYFWRILSFPMGYALIITTIFLMITFSTLRITKLLHKRMIDRVMNAPINLYFDKTPSGRILNRFSKDINRLDDGISQ